MKQTFLILFYFVFTLCVGNANTENTLNVFSQVNMEEVHLRIEQGRKQLEKTITKKSIKNKIEKPFLKSEETPCWKYIVLDLLNNVCGQEELNYQNKALIAYKLTHCHLLQSGISIDPCQNKKSDEIVQCVKKLTEDFRAFSTYNNFFTYTDDICLHHIVQSEQKMVAQSIYQLYTATLNTGEYLENMERESLKFHEQLKLQHGQWLEEYQRQSNALKTLQQLSDEQIEKQNKALANQKLMMEFNANMNGEMKKLNDRQNDLMESQTKMSLLVENVSQVGVFFVIFKIRQRSLNENVENSIRLQQESQKTQEEILRKQMETLEDVEKSKQIINAHFQQTHQNQLHLLNEEQKTVEKMNEISTKASELEELNKQTYKELQRTTEQQLIRLNQTNEFIHELYTVTEESYHSVMESINDILIIVKNIYALDIHTLHHFMSLNFVVFYFAWIVWFFILKQILCYVATVPVRVQSARTMMYGTTFIGFWCEKYFSSYFVNWNSEQPDLTRQNTVVLFFIKFNLHINYTKFQYNLEQIISSIRWIIVTANYIVYFYFMLNYESMDQKQLKLLQNIQKSLQIQTTKSQGFQLSSLLSLTSTAFYRITPTNLKHFMKRSKRRFHF
ncbi:hypothetical protein RFI_38229 [Reticulomyxa filosa]|uniref:Viral A-type inclusion protein n=1 Tax=Reticulomyxa filosa TaxID=46433 RepID=X6LCH8_RETFI|nr:hypothetical protein RFI_38229 [Reticulomyxa filosa]|eukprot:ETN99253.1 hypothetical protein RFI_38229 [Reticulomyxa filosa]